MRISKFLAAAAAASLVATPLMAQGSASKLSVARAGATLQDANDQEGSGSGVVIAIAAAAAVGLGIYVLVDNNDEDDLPTSP